MNRFTSTHTKTPPTSGLFAVFYQAENENIGCQVYHVDNGIWEWLDCWDYTFKSEEDPLHDSIIGSSIGIEIIEPGSKELVESNPEEFQYMIDEILFHYAYDSDGFHAEYWQYA